MTTGKQPFEEMDEVRLRTGNSKMLVAEIKYFEEPPKTRKHKYVRKSDIPGWYVRAAYVSTLNFQGSTLSDCAQEWRHADDYTHYGEPPMPQLYLIKGSDPAKYGTYLTHDSQGRLVLEMKGDGGVRAFGKEELEEVTPYTVSMQAPSDGRTHHIIVKKGTVSKDDILLDIKSGVIYRVTELDTKCKNPAHFKNPLFRLHLDPIELSE